MKLRLLILLLAAAALAAAPATAQTIKSLGYNTTNGFVTYSGSNSLTFTNALQFSTNARAATRTNLDLGAAWLTNTSVTNFRTAIGLGATWLTNTNVTNFRTDIGLGATNSVTFSNITASGIINAKDSTATPATNAAAAQGIQWSGLGGSQHAAIYGGYSGAVQIALSVGTTSNALSDVATFRATGMTISSNAIVGGTLAVSGNVTMSGIGNTAPSQTADSASSLMTRELSDARYLGLKSHSINFSMMSTRTTNGGASSISRGSWQLFTPTNLSSFASVWGAWGYLLGLDVAQQYVNFTNPFSISFSRSANPANLPRTGLVQYVQLGRDVSSISTTNIKLAQKGVGIQFASNGVTPFVHNGTSLTDGSLITNISTYNRFVLRWVPATAFEVYGVANGSEPVLLGSVTSNLPTGIGVSDSVLEFSQLDSGSGGANSFLFLTTAYITTP